MTMRTKHRIGSRFIALLLTAAMLLTLMVFMRFLILTAVADDGQDVIIRDDALHFIIRHWHTDYDEEANHQGGQREEGDESNYFVLLEGYIIPKTDEEKERDGDNFTIVLVNQATGALEKASTLYNDKDYNDPTTPYLGALDKENGVIEIRVKPLREENQSAESGYDDLENFAGFSMSAGRGAVSYVYDEYETGENGESVGVKGTESAIRITYSPYTHLVKGHFFYTSWTKTVPGTSDPTVFDPNSQDFKEIDTAEVYTWNASGSGHTAGEIVKYTKDAEDFACETEDDLKEKANLEGLNLEDLKAAVTLTKFYSTNEGLHTNKTLMQTGDDRLFLYDLEAWYVEGYAPQLGFILDASGGMAFPSDSPTVINVYSALLDQLGTLGVSKNSDGKYVYSGKVYDDPKDLFTVLENLKDPQGGQRDGHQMIVDALSAVVTHKVTVDDVHGLLHKIGELENQKNNNEPYYEYPQHDKLIGYYEFVANNGNANAGYNGYRTWVLNTVAAGLDTSSKFTYDDIESKEGFFAKEVQQGNSGAFDFSVPYNDYPIYSDWPANHGLNLSNTTGLNIGSTTKSGMLLEIVPEDSFTLSFSSGVNPTSNTAEILYIGPLKGEKSSAEFRMTSESGYFRIYSNGDEIWSKSASGNTRFNLVYNGSSLSIYLGSALDSTVELSLSSSNIVFAPFVGNYDNTLYVDDVFLYDTALNGNEVRQLVAAYSGGKGINEKSTSTINWNDVFIDDSALLLLLNPRNTVHTTLGVAAYSYYVGSGDIIPLGYWDGTKSEAKSALSNSIVISTAEGVNLGVLQNDGSPGWYAVSHGGNINSINDLLGDVGSAKRFYGIGKSSGTDSIDGAPEGTNTEVEYTNSIQGACPFYLDSEGNLRCFYSTSTNGAFTCSYVYLLEDSQYVKTEALQRVLANFTTKLAEESPSSKVSAVRFSTNEYKNVDDGLKALVLLDWTDDPIEVSKMMSQVRGDGSANIEKGYDLSAAGVKEYNYSLTGGTYVWTGLRAFYDTLIMDEQTGARRDDEDAPKFVVIFTDGADNGITSYNSSTGQITISSETKQAVEDVKKKGYTIITVYTPDAGDTPGTENYEKAKAFLTQIAGTQNANDGADYFFESRDLSELSRIFEEQLLSQLTDKIGGYTVQDYIDPRFDLRNADGTVWKLKANGRVEKVKVDGTVEIINVTQKDSKTNDYYTFHLAGSSTPSARDPYLLYDAAEDMYYLRWVDQTIPSSAVGARDLLPVWNAEVYLIAKDDFIGGNTILTGGNEEKMNWVYHPADLSKEAYDEYYDGWDEDEDGEKKISAYDASSGTGDMYKEFKKTVVDSKEVNDYDNPIDEYVSKGFPRTMANVALLPIDTKDLDGIMYLGEAVSPMQLLVEIKDEYITESYYLDYLKRYAYQRYQAGAGSKAEMDMSLWDLLIEWLEINNDDVYKKEFSIPYMYLPSVEYDDETGKVASTTQLNNTGGKIHEQDVVGILTYRWEQLDPTPTNYKEPIKDFVKNNTERIKYSLTVEFTPLQVGDTLATLDAAVSSQIAAIAAYGVPMAPIIAAEETESGRIIPARVREGIFAGYIPLEGEKDDFPDDYCFNRETYVNSVLIQDTAYKWNKEYKPEVNDVQLDNDIAPGEEGYPYGDATFLNSGRTLTAFSQYTLDVVSGGIALELKVLIGELEEAAEKNGGVFKKEFTLNATRSFQDTDFVEKLKKEQYTGEDNDHPAWEDYGNSFTITFSFDYDAAKIAALEKDPDGYVRIYAVTTKITANQANFTNIGQNLTELPIGTYDFSLDDINEQLKDVLAGALYFAAAEHDSDETHFDEAYFDELVLNGLHTTNEGTGSAQKWREKRNKNGEIIYGEDGQPEGYETAAEINNGNIKNFIAGAGTDADKTIVSFCIGTVARDPDKPNEPYVATRGKVVKNPYDPTRYTNDRLGILLLSTGMTKLTIEEKGGQSNESFLYHITGTTLGGKNVNLTVSVNGDAAKGERSTTIVIPPGEYTVEEDPYWSWRYDNKATNGKNGEDWTLYPDDLKKASTSLRYRNDDPVEDHKTIIYEHERNDKVWLGGENYKDNHFNH